MSHLSCVPLIRCAPVVCVLAACAAVPHAHGQIVPVSRLGTITTYTNSSSNGPNTTTNTYTDWASGTQGNSAGGQTLTLAPGSITAETNASGSYSQGPNSNPFFSWARTTSTVALTFDILAPATYTLSGLAEFGYGGGSVVLSTIDGASLFSYDQPGSIGSAPLNSAGALAPGRYVLTVTAAGQALGPGGPGTGPLSTAHFTATLTVVPAPGAAAALAGAVTLLARRRRR